MSKVTAKDILKDKFNVYYSEYDGQYHNGRQADAIVPFDQALALLQAEIEKCLPEKEEEQPPTSTLEGTAIEIASRNYTWGYNKAIDETRYRLREFINLEDKDGDSDV